MSVQTCDDVERALQLDLLICVPFADPAAEALQRISQTWNVPILNDRRIAQILFGPNSESPDSPDGSNPGNQNLKSGDDESWADDAWDDGYATTAEAEQTLGLLIDRLGVLPMPIDHPRDRALARDLFSLDINLLIALDDERHGTQPGSIEWLVEALRIAVYFARIKGTHALLVNGFEPDAIVLGFDRGEITLNQDWDGWQRWPELLDLFPRPHRLEKLRGNPDWSELP